VTADVRDRLRQLSDAHGQATAGPWAQHPSDGEYIIGEVSADGDNYLDVADTYAFRKQTGYADAAAIVAAHNAVPWLVAALTAVLDLADELDTLGELNLTRADRVSNRELDEQYRLGRSLSYMQAAGKLRAVVAAAEGEGE
jgi:hypothetical protein